jgi:regulator of protease activity HflC (stomatin/prohibitin superfamily)
MTNTKNELRPVFRRVVFFAYLFALGLSIFLGGHSSIVMDEEWNWGEVTFLVTILFTIASYRTVGPFDFGVRLFFGKVIDEVGSGLVFVPVGFCSLRKFSNLVQQAELPAEPEDIYRGTAEDPDGKNIPKGKYPPIRIVFGEPKNKGSQNVDDPYNHRMAVEVTPVVRYRMVDAVKFVKTIGSWESARRQIEDVVVATLNEKFSQMSPSEALKKLHKINLKLSGKNGVIDSMLTDWGLDLESIRIKPFGFSHKLNDAVMAVPIAMQRKKVSIIDAEGARETKRLEGEGKGAAEKAELEGRAAGFKNMAETLKNLGVEGRMVLGAETARAVTNNPGQKTVVVGADGFSNLIGLATSVSETLKPSSSTEGS